MASAAAVVSDNDDGSGTTVTARLKLAPTSAPTGKVFVGSDLT